MCKHTFLLFCIPGYSLWRTLVVMEAALTTAWEIIDRDLKAIRTNNGQLRVCRVSLDGNLCVTNRILHNRIITVDLLKVLNPIIVSILPAFKRLDREVNSPFLII